MAGDLPVLDDIYLRGRRRAFPWMPGSAHLDGEFHRDTDGELVLVADLDGRAVGFSSSWLPDRFIHHLYIEPHLIGQGLGARLLDATVARIGTPARLKCVQRNRRALEFYLARGWEPGATGDGEAGIWVELVLV